MDKSSNDTYEQQNSDTNSLDLLSVELNDIIIKNELALKQSAELFAQITDCEARQEYFNSSFKEAEKIAREITDNSSQRVEKIMARAENVVELQRKQIVCTEQEISKLTREMNELSEKNKAKAQITDLSYHPKFSQREPQKEILEDASEMKKVESDKSTLPLLDKCEEEKDQPELNTVCQNESLINDTLDSDDSDRAVLAKLLVKMLQTDVKH